jgi:ADP-heptose:LPS heptosyltransferase
MSGPGGGGGAVLVIKHGGLGDFVQALGAMKAIRARHRNVRVVLLTTGAHAEMGREAGWFDDVWIDDRPSLLGAGAWFALARRLRAEGFGRVYDLQTSQRTAAYFRFLMPRPRPEWCGIVRGCSHPHDNPDRARLHTIDRLADQLARAGIDFVPPTDVSWMNANVSHLTPEGRFALLVPGGSAHRSAKRWPAISYAALAWRLRRADIHPVLIGAKAEARVGAAIAAACPEVRNLTGRTGFAEIVELARRAEVAVGNDTGPMHLAAAAACPTLVLFSAASDPALCAPRGRAVTVLRRERLEELGIDEVASAAGLG